MRGWGQVGVWGWGCGRPGGWEGWWAGTALVLLVHHLAPLTQSRLCSHRSNQTTSREDVHRELTFTEARRALVGDVNLLRRIYRFLSAWQLINFLARRRPALADGSGASGKGALGVAGIARARAGLPACAATV